VRRDKALVGVFVQLAPFGQVEIGTGRLIASVFGGFESVGRAGNGAYGPARREPAQGRETRHAVQIGQVSRSWSPAGRPLRLLVGGNWEPHRPGWPDDAAWRGRRSRAVARVSRRARVTWRVLFSQRVQVFAVSRLLADLLVSAGLLIGGISLRSRVRSWPQVLALRPRRIRRVGGRRQLKSRDQIAPGGLIAAAIPIRVAPHGAPRVVR
jgi:hypothetical protein